MKKVEHKVDFIVATPVLVSGMFPVAEEICANLANLQGASWVGFQDV